MYLRVVFSGLDVLEVDLEPVRAGLGEAVGEDGAVLAEGVDGEAHRAVVGERVRVQEHLRVGLQRLLLVHHAANQM